LCRNKGKKEGILAFFKKENQDTIKREVQRQEEAIKRKLKMWTTATHL
jgi:hypothetical protein